MSDSLEDPFIFDLVDRFGGDGYMVFFGVLEIMSREFDVNSPGTCTVSERFLTKRLLLSRQKTVKILNFLNKKGRVLSTFKDGEIILNCPKLKEMCDDFTKRKLRSESVACSVQEVEEEVEEEVEVKEDKGLRPPEGTGEPASVVDDVKIEGGEALPDAGGEALPGARGEALPGAEGGDEVVPATVAVAVVADSTVCPHKKIIALYHEILTELPSVQVWSSERAGLLKTRWKEDPVRQNLTWWKDYFLKVKSSPFLTGKEKPWQADLEWLIRPRNMPKVIEGRYRERFGNAGKGRQQNVQPSTFHQAEKQSRSKLARMLLDGKITLRNRSNGADDAQLPLP